MSDVKQTLGQFVGEASRIVGFTGAGISTECGIPDFRSPGGIWSKYKPIDFQTFMASPEARREALHRYIKIREHVGDGRVLYPGSYVDVAASFVFSNVTYVDMDRRANRFFGDADGVREIIDAEGGSPAAQF